jgi:hypothetical protein
MLFLRKMMIQILKFIHRHLIPKLKLLSKSKSNTLLRCQELNQDISTLQCDPGLRPQIWKYDVNQQDEIRRANLKAGPYRWVPSSSFEYPFSNNEKNRRRFQSSWYTMFDWLEYSPAEDIAYCLPCYIFSKKSTSRFGAHAFTIEGFRN